MISLENRLALKCLTIVKAAVLTVSCLVGAASERSVFVLDSVSILRLLSDMA